MKKTFTLIASAALLLVAVSCGQKKAETAEINYIDKGNYTLVEAPETDLAGLEVDDEGYYVLFNGKDFTGWRGYGKDHVPSKWVVEDGCIKFNGTGGGEAQMGDGGDIIFTHQFQNFVFEFEWKVEKAANSGVFYLAKETAVKNENGEYEYQPIYISCPEYQILDNANHPDSFLGVDGNRKSASLYDMIPANPQNQNPYGEWNKGKIMVFQGTVVHYQNDANVLEYHLWTPRWTEMLQASKFSEQAWPLAFELLNNCGGDDHKGYFGFQDHGDVVYYRNIRVKLFE
ncbi:MAG: DUF1080 domain-containing protein [Bacteroidales bacterium]|nr:DUF1080 domain-containing protein [Bacteroidales bacterium]